MAYTVLARRYRSATFDEVVGQNHVAQTLKKAIASDRVAHAYLFCGTRGTGKTSMARILAKALNCEKSDRPTPEPCLECNSCRAIASGEDIDVIEIDAASNRGIDEVRKLIENSAFRPARSRFKVFIVDEVHAMTRDAFNALLKVLEEPPEHVKFVLATTEPEKILPTILSRCQRYDFRNIPTREIAGHLKEICKEEGIKADEDALMLVAKAGAGSMRDSLSLLDRLLSIGEKKLTVESIEQLLGLPRGQAIFDLVQAMGEGKVKEALGLADQLINEGLSADGLIVSLVDHLRNLLIIRTCGAESNLVEMPTLPAEEVAKQAGRFEAVTLTQDITILEDLRRQLRQSSAGRALLDATIVRLALAEQFSSLADLIARVDGAGSEKKKFEQGIETAPVHAPPVLEVRQAVVEQAGPEPVMSAMPAAMLASDLDLDEGDALPAVGKVWDDGPKRSLGAIMKEQRLAAAAAPAAVAAPVRAEGENIEAVDPGNLPAVWRRLLDRLSEKVSIHSMISQGRLTGIVEDQAVISFGESFPATLLSRQGKKELICETLTTVLGRPTGVRFEVDPNQPAQPAAAAARAAAPAPAASTRITPEQMEQLKQDPLIGRLMAEFNADPIAMKEEM